MHHEVTKALWDYYSAEDKVNFFKAYIYLKYMHHFAYQGLSGMGFAVGAPPEELDESIAEFLEIYKIGLGEGFFDPNTNPYHAKIVQTKEAIKLVTQKEDLCLHPSEKVIPYKIARDIVLTNSDSIAVSTCVCRLCSATPCLPPPMEVCLFIGDPHASFVAHNTKRGRRISQDEAVKIIEESHKRGFVHSAFFKEDMGNRFYAICNCCKCCCSSIKMWHLLGMSNIVSSGYVAEVSADCNGCGACTSSCNFNAISLDQNEDKAVVNLEKCMGCGVCVDQCPIEAVSLRLEPSKGEPLDLDKLKKHGE